MPGRLGSFGSSESPKPATEAPAKAAPLEHKRKSNAVLGDALPSGRLSYYPQEGCIMIDVAELVPMPEAARLVGRSTQTLRLWARTGRVRSRNLGGRLWVFDRQDLERVAAEMNVKIAERIGA